MPSLVLRSTLSVALQSPLPWRRCWRNLAPFSGGMVSHALLHAGQRWAGRHIGPDRNLESSTVVHGQRDGLQAATNEWPRVGCWAPETHVATLVRSPLRSGQVVSALFEKDRVHGLVNETLPIVMGGIDLLLGPEGQRSDSPSPQAESPDVDESGFRLGRCTRQVVGIAGIGRQIALSGVVCRKGHAHSAGGRA